LEYDAILVVSFGGPEKPDDVVPFLENVLRGRRIPRERLEEVAAHYRRLGGRSPINDQVRALIGSLVPLLLDRGIALPIYRGNRNWHPMLADTVARMRDDGVRRALAFVTSAWSSYSSCRQYLENIEEACAGEALPAIDKIPPFGADARFVELQRDLTRAALEAIPADRRADALVLFSAHSIPLAMAESCRYETELRDAAGRIASALGIAGWRLVFQSRSGPPQQPWLGPDIGDALREARPRDVVVVPLGFLSDHMEVIYDLDVQAREVCLEIGASMVRAATAGLHPGFAGFVCELIAERLTAGGVSPCAADCCREAREVDGRT
jgi:ferrochelatase